MRRRLPRTLMVLLGISGFTAGTAAAQDLHSARGGRAGGVVSACVGANSGRTVGDQHRDDGRPTALERESRAGARARLHHQALHHRLHPQPNGRRSALHYPGDRRRAPGHGQREVDRHLGAGAGRRSHPGARRPLRPDAPGAGPPAQGARGSSARGPPCRDQQDRSRRLTISHRLVTQLRGPALRTADRTGGPAREHRLAHLSAGPRGRRFAAAGERVSRRRQPHGAHCRHDGGRQQPATVAACRPRWRVDASRQHRRRAADRGAQRRGA